MTEQQQTERYTELTVVERISQTDGSPTQAFACAVEGEGTYYFSSLNLPSDMGSDTPTIHLDKSHGTLSVERNNELLWQSGNISNRGGGMGNEQCLFLLGVPEDFIVSNAKISQEHDGSTQVLNAAAFQIGDVVKLRDPENLLDAIYIQLHSQWERHKMRIETAQAEIDDPSEARELDIEVLGEQDARSTEEIVSQYTEQIAQNRDQLIFEPLGT